jgi:hypothetical protein
MPTQRQIKTIKKISENLGNKPLGKILRESGYSESTSKTPGRVISTKSWQSLLNDYFPDDLLLDIHKSLLLKKETVSYRGNVIVTKQPHSDARQALELMYKLKGKLQIENVKSESEFDNLTPTELDNKYEELTKEHKWLLDRYYKYRK